MCTGCSATDLQIAEHEREPAGQCENGHEHFGPSNDKGCSCEGQGTGNADGSDADPDFSFFSVSYISGVQSFIAVMPTSFATAIRTTNPFVAAGATSSRTVQHLTTLIYIYRNQKRC